MSEEPYFNNELRKCLNAAGLSDYGENDEWNYWYQRVHKAHDQAVDRVTEAQRVENAKLRKLLSSALIVAGFKGRQYLDAYLKEEEGTTLWQELKGLGIEADG